MTTLNMIRAPIDIGALARWAKERGWVRHKGGYTAFDEGKALHHLIHEALGPDAFQCFRLLVPPRRIGGSLYAYSALDAETLRSTAAVHAPPEHLEVLPAIRIVSKPMPNNWRSGQQLGFDLRVRPVRRLSSSMEMPSGETIRKGAEVDAFLAEAFRQHLADANGMATKDRTRQAVYLDWLAERLAPAAILEFCSTRLARFRRLRVARRGKGPEGPDATIHGTLTVDDPAAFSDLLARGVGRHRSYGYGMLLLRPPNRPALQQ